MVMMTMMAIRMLRMRMDEVYATDKETRSVTMMLMMIGLLTIGSAAAIVVANLVTQIVETLMVFKTLLQELKTDNGLHLTRL